MLFSCVKYNSGNDDLHSSIDRIQGLTEYTAHAVVQSITSLCNPRILGLFYSLILILSHFVLLMNQTETFSTLAQQNVF